VWQRCYSKNDALSILVIGGFTNDLIGSGALRVGGPAYYITTTLMQLDEAPAVITNSYKLLDVVNHAFMCNKVYAPKSDGVFVFEIRESNGSRKLRLARRGPSINNLVEELISKWADSSIKFDVAIVSPVFNEVSSEVVAKLGGIADYIVVDIQGFVRKCSDRYCTVIVDERRFYDLVNVLAGSVNVIRGELHEFPEECRGLKISKCVAGLVDVVQTSGPGNMYVYLSKLGKTIKLRPLPGIEGSNIGAGDVFTGVLAYFMGRGMDLLSSCARASVAAGLRVGRPGKLWFTLSELEALSHKILRHINS